MIEIPSCGNIQGHEASLEGVMKTAAQGRLILKVGTEFNIFLHIFMIIMRY